ncbi:nucleoside-diphosphate kinase [Labrenzia sp. PO1]|jgi:regulator of nucleoside diphosphate kinase|uniref:nucleoside-diphosphate kinase n=1 Tax=Stappiaceae TaxID=2821832 RepID=UPI0014454E88|nr:MULTISPECIES: nucleoside-diphosphate kinase [unclassified Labrenzia]MBO9462175.1 nucleoside-diphosphate kinase [Labrenzia sp. R5_0]NKI61477.1 nucleoside-diphosphate kinase [Labrenzia sp. PO1]
MREPKQFIFTNKDYATLTRMVSQCPRTNTPFVSLLRRKLAQAHVVPSSEIPVNVVTMNSRVTFQVDDHAPDTRVVIPDEADSLVGLTLPITTTTGMALLGMSEKQSIDLTGFGRQSRTLTVIGVAYQPEAMGGVRLDVPQGPISARRQGRPFLHLVHSSDEDAEGNLVHLHR